MLNWFLIALGGKPSQYKYLILHTLVQLGYVDYRPHACITDSGVHYVTVLVNTIYARRGNRKRAFAANTLRFLSDKCCDQSQCEKFKDILSQLVYA